MMEGSNSYYSDEGNADRVRGCKETRYPSSQSCRVLLVR